MKTVQHIAGYVFGSSTTTSNSYERHQQPLHKQGSGDEDIEVIEVVTSGRHRSEQNDNNQPSRNRSYANTQAGPRSRPVDAGLRSSRTPNSSFVPSCSRRSDRGSQDQNASGGNPLRSKRRSSSQGPAPLPHDPSPLPTAAFSERWSSKPRSDAESEIKRLRIQIEKLESDKHQLQKSLARETENAQFLESRFSRLERKHDEARNLLEARGLELQSAQAFLGKTDQCSAFELKQMISSLNDDIFQTASFLTDAVLSNDAFQHGRSTCVDKRCRDASCVPPDRSRAPDLVLQLRSRQERSELLEQFFLQHMLTSAATRQIESWSRNEQVDNHIRAVLGLMKQCEPAEVSGKWRALAQVYNPETSDQALDLGGVFSALEDHIHIGLREMGYQGGVDSIVVSSSAQGCRDKLQGMAEKIVALRNTIHRLVTSHHVRVVWWDAGRTFRPARMENELENDLAAAEMDKVAATIAIGLCVMDPAEAEEGDTDKFLLKPRVVLRSCLSQM